MDQILEKDPKNCPNCENPLRRENVHCSNCGQKITDLNRPFKYIIGEFVDNYFNVNSKLLATFKELLFYPGLLTKNFMEGKRASYLPPIRLFLVCSILFFFMFSVGNKKVSRGLDSEMKNSMSDTSKIDINLFNESFKISGDSIKQYMDMSEDEIKAAFASQGKNLGWLNLKILQQTSKFINNGSQTFFYEYAKLLNILTLVLIPLFALLLSLFFRSKNYIYHLIFSLQFHALYFIIATIGFLIQFLTPGFPTGPFAFLLTIVLLFFWIRKNYKPESSRIFIKYLGLVVSYFVVFGIGLLGITLTTLTIF